MTTTLYNTKTGEALGPYIHRNEMMLRYRKADGTIGEISVLDATSTKPVHVHIPSYWSSCSVCGKQGVYNASATREP